MNLPDLSKIELKPEEREQVEKILRELASRGKSEAYYELLKLYYEEIPVSIDEFVENPDYLGKSTNNGKGIYPYWRETLRKVLHGGKSYEEIIFSGCVEGATRIPLLDGTNPTILEMYDRWSAGERKFWVYSYDHRTNRIVPGKVTNIYCSGVVPTYKITFDDGSSVRCSWDHQFLLRDGHYKYAKDLKPDDSIMPLNRYRLSEKIIVRSPQPDGSFIDHGIGEYESAVHNKHVLALPDDIKDKISEYNKIYKTQGYLTYSPETTDIINNYFDGDTERFLSVVINYNHKVVSVEYTKENIIVYDLTVEDTHNFAIVPVGGDPNSCIFNHNAIGLGKSFIGCIICAYLLYKLLCLKNPQEYYNLAPNAYITFAFFNIHKYLSLDVAYGQFQRMLMDSPWFLRHGEIRGVKNREYYPDKGINFMVGCDEEHAIGMNIFCLAGDNILVCKEYGDSKTIGELENQHITPLVWNGSEYRVSSSKCKVVRTKTTNIITTIEFDNGETLKSTPDHHFLTSEGIYKAASNLTINDKLDGSSDIISISTDELDKAIPVYDVLEVPIYHNYAIMTPHRSLCVVSHNCGLLDEMSFAKRPNADILKSGVMKLYRSVKTRMTSRFTREGVLQAKMLLISSKRTDSDFLDQYAEQQKGNPSTYIVDEPQWIVKPKGTYSEKTFRLAVGSKTKKSIIIPDDSKESDDFYLANGYTQVIHPPVDMRPRFEFDMDANLRDLAGISTTVFTKFISYEKLSKCYTTKLKNPFQSSRIEIGLEDDLQLMEFYDDSKVPDWLKELPIYVHVDIALSGDAYGLGAVAVAGTKTHYSIQSGEQATDPFYIVVFSVGIKAPRGDQVSLEKVRQFIYWLKFNQNYNIVRFSADGFNSADTLQAMRTRGIPADLISLDRAPCNGYLTLRTAIYEKRVAMYEDKNLETELINLERNEMTQKVDHPSDGSKDISDTIAGSLYNGSLHMEEYSSVPKYIDMMLEVNEEKKSYAESTEDELTAQLMNITKPKTNKTDNIVKDTDDIDTIMEKVTGNSVDNSKSDKVSEEMKNYYAAMGIII